MINKERAPQFPRRRRNAGPTSFDPALQLSPCAQSPPAPFSLFPSFIQTTSFLSTFFGLGKWLLFKFKTSSQYLLSGTEGDSCELYRTRFDSLDSTQRHYFWRSKCKVGDRLFTWNCSTKSEFWVSIDRNQSKFCFFRKGVKGTANLILFLHFVFHPM